MSLRTELDKLERNQMPDLKNGVPGLQMFSRHQTGQGDRSPVPNERVKQLGELNNQGDSLAVYLGLLVGIAVVLRLLVVLMGPMNDLSQAYTADTLVQLELAHNLADHGTYGLAVQPEGSLERRLDSLRAERGSLPLADTNDLRPEAYRPPGYPMLLAVFDLIGQRFTWLLLLQCALGGACVALTYGVAKALLRRKGAAMIAAALVAVHPGLILAAAVLSPETVVATLVLLGLFGIVSVEHRTIRSALGGGLALGTAALFTPMLVWLAPLAAGWVLLSEHRWRGGVLAMVLFIGAAVPVGGWMYRNTAVGMDARLSASTSINRLFGAVADLDGPTEASTHEATVNALLAEVREESRLPRYADRTLFAAVDHLAWARLWAARGDTVRLLQDRAATLMLDHSAARFHQVFGIRYVPAGAAERFLGRDTPKQAEADPATAPLIAGLVGLNAALLVGAVLGGTLMGWRRRYGAVVLGVMAGGLLIWIALPGASETLRLPLVSLQALMVSGLLLPSQSYVKRAKPAAIRRAERIDAAAGRMSPPTERVVAGGRPI